MGKESTYQIRFEFMEECLLNLGNDLREVVGSIENHYNNPNKPILMKDKIYQRLTEIAGALSVIREEVNKETKKVIDFLYFKCKTLQGTSKQLNISYKNLLHRHYAIVDEILDIIGLNVSRKYKYKRTNRSIPTKIKKEVFERDKGACTECGSNKNLHYHHIVRFAEGGTHTTDNLKLLCPKCHTNEHKNERVYEFMKNKYLG